MIPTAAHAPGVVLDHRGIVVGADPRSITHAQEITESIKRRKARIAEDFYALGEDLVRLKTGEFYRKVYGYATFTGYLEGEKIYSVVQARKLMKIAQSMSKSRAIALGVEKAYAAIALTDATVEKDTAEEIFAKGTKVAGKKPAKATVKDFVVEAKQARKKALAGKRRSPEQLAHDRALAAGVLVLRGALAKVGLGKVTIALHSEGANISISQRQLEALGTKR